MDLTPTISRIFCVADEETFGCTPDTCVSLQQVVIMDYVDYDGRRVSISSARCKDPSEEPTLLQSPPYASVSNGGTFAQLSCAYRQTRWKPDSRYCETMGVGWDVTGDYLRSAQHLLGREEVMLEQVNPNFSGVNQPPFGPALTRARGRPPTPALTRARARGCFLARRIQFACGAPVRLATANDSAIASVNSQASGGACEAPVPRSEPQEDLCPTDPHSACLSLLQP